MNLGRVVSPGFYLLFYKYEKVAIFLVLLASKIIIMFIYKIEKS